MSSDDRAISIRRLRYCRKHSRSSARDSAVPRRPAAAGSAVLAV